MNPSQDGAMDGNPIVQCVENLLTLHFDGLVKSPGNAGMTLCSFRQAQDKLTRQYQARTWHQGFRISPKFGSPRDGEGDTKGLKGIR